MAWISGAIMAVGALVGNKMSSNAQKKAADKNAKAIKNAQGMTDERYNQIRKDVLSLFDGSMASVFDGMQESRNLILSGQASVQDVLNKAYSGASQTLQTYSQQAINAMLGETGQPPTIENMQQAAQQVAPEQQARAGLPEQAATGLQPLTETPAGIDVPQQTGIDAPQQIDDFVPPTQRPDLTGGETPYGYEDAGDIPYRSQGVPLPPPPQVPLLSPTTPLEGEFIPAGYDLPTPTGLNVPQGQYGLAGAEGALTSAADRSRMDVGMGALTGIDALGRELGFAGEEVRRGRDYSIGAITDAMQTGRMDISRGAEKGAASALAGANRGVSFLSPYMQTGESVQERLLALSGAKGQEAFDAAVISDPELAYNLERSERALGRQAALTGNIGSGSVMAEIERNARMEESANIERNYNRLFGLSEAGRGAASTAGGFTTQAGITAGGIESQAGRDMANVAVQGGGALSGIGQQASAQIADLARTMGISELQAMQMMGRDLGQIGMQTGQQVGDYRYSTGLNLQNLLSQQGREQAQLQTGYGGNIADIDMQTAINLANQAEQLGEAQSGLQTGLAGSLSNLGTGNITQQANLGLNLGQAQAQGVTNPWGNALSTMTGLYASNPNAFNFNQPTQQQTQPQANMTFNYGQIPTMFSQPNQITGP